MTQQCSPGRSLGSQASCLAVRTKVAIFHVVPQPLKAIHPAPWGAQALAVLLAVGAPLLQVSKPLSAQVGSARASDNRVS